MIDLEKAKQEFENYIKQYNLEDEKIKLKVVHTYETIKCSKMIATKLQLSEEEIQLAQLIALLHDIGRFEQQTKYKEFEDYKSLDHAKYGVKILFQEGLIRRFIQEDTFDNIIYEAIKNHNLYQIEKGLDERELLHAKIIRDADKLDNFRVKDTEKLEVIFSHDFESIEFESITEKVFEDFMAHKTILTTQRITQIDIWISYIAFIFDLNFEVSKKYVEENGYVDRLIDRISYRNEDTKKKMEQIRVCAKEFLEK